VIRRSRVSFPLEPCLVKRSGSRNEIWIRRIRDFLIAETGSLTEEKKAKTAREKRDSSPPRDAKFQSIRR